MLALIGSGEYLPPIQAVDRDLLAQLDEPARVVCLPTAAGTEGLERIAYWSDLGVAHFTQLGAQAEALPIIDTASANNPEFARRIGDANFVYLSGGKPSYLYQTLQGSLAWQAIQEVLARGGILAGCSAGAMIMGARIPGFPRWQSAFGLLPETVVIPHFEEMSAVMVKLARFLSTRRLTLLGIEGNTALVAQNSHYRVSGSGGVTVWNRSRKQRYTQGEMIQW